MISEKTLRFSEFRFLSPWGEGFLTREAYLRVIEERIALSRTWRYRLGRLVEQMRRKPVRPGTQWLVKKLHHVAEIQP